MYYLNLVKQEILKIISSDSLLLNEYSEFIRLEFTTYLQKSVLVGEYYEDEALRTITDISNGLIELETAQTINQSNPQGGENRKEYIEAIELSLHQFILPYKNFIRRISINLKEEKEQDEIDDIWEIQDFHFKESRSIGVHAAKASLFRVNLILANIDEYLQCNNQIRKGLAIIKNDLEKYKNILDNDEILSNLIDKLDFLEFKIKYRDIHPKMDKPDLEEDYSSVDSSNRYISFYNKAVKHYAPYNRKNLDDNRKRAEAIKDAQPDRFQLEPFHYLNRYYRKKKKKLRDALNDVTELKTKLHSFANAQSTGDISIKNIEKMSPYDKIALVSIQNYLENTFLSLTLALEKKRKFSTIIQSIKKFIRGESNQTETEVLYNYIEKIDKINISKDHKDYYAYIIYISFLDEMTDGFKLDAQSIIEFDKNDDRKISLEEKKKKIEEMIVGVKNVYRKAFFNLRNNYDNQPKYRTLSVYLPKNECFSDWLLDGKYPLFLRSSYILPINFNKLETKIQEGEFSLSSNLKALADSFKVAFSQITITNSITDFEKKVKENEFKTVQIVAMFVSIATFVLINVKIFDNKTGIESFAIILGLACCFFLFNLFFYIVILVQYTKTRLSSLQTILKILFCLIVPSVMGFTSYQILSHDPYGTPKEMEEIYKKLDSVSNKLVIDSTRLRLDSVKIANDSAQIKKLDIKINNLNKFRQVTASDSLP